MHILLCRCLSCNIWVASSKTEFIVRGRNRACIVDHKHCYHFNSRIALYDQAFTASLRKLKNHNLLHLTFNFDFFLFRRGKFLSNIRSKALPIIFSISISVRRRYSKAQPILLNLSNSSQDFNAGIKNRYNLHKDQLLIAQT
jgi:hypothetical protein